MPAHVLPLLMDQVQGSSCVGGVAMSAPIVVALIAHAVAAGRGPWAVGRGRGAC
ncbi:hypothetical protein DB30_05088 [Enhygromyxa salina]|uniref:Uncharacterized protein n=1 Tax=Enhygromyxa salina TaxID=215803 RepID=A0A0C2D789_9BACT|nr:hypothetical protein DB30_05088 [Enhygromyxa salina]